VTGWVVVTGASSGIGRAIAEGFLKEGRRVVAVARRADRLTELTDVHGTDLLRVEAVDVRDEDAVHGLLAGLDVDVLVNNAGLSLGLGPLSDGDPGDWRTMIDTNIAGVLACTGAVLPGMLAAGRGHIVNLGSLAAEHEYFGGNVYAASKAFVHHLSANLRVDVQGTGVRVTCVAPGMVRTEFAQVRFKGDAGRADALYTGIQPLSSVDVASAVLWACNTPPHVNINYVELMSVDQPFGLSLSRSNTRRESP
jgi:NADP-dependent 3-hydroxy acid dehydrogenase YdfG